MTSRLYAAAYSSSEDESDNEVSGKVNIQPFMRPVQSDSEDEKRVVRSAKDKRHEEIQNVLRNLNNHKKIKDMSKVEVDFDELVKLYEKAQKMNEVDTYPKFYIRVLAQMEDFINESWEQKKSLSKMAAKSLTILKQRIRKYNKDFEEQIKKYRENPELYEEEEDEEEEEESEESESDAEPSKQASTKVRITFHTFYFFRNKHQKNPTMTIPCLMTTSVRIVIQIGVIVARTLMSTILLFSF